MMIVHLTAYCKVIQCRSRWLYATRSDYLPSILRTGCKLPSVTRQSICHIIYPYHLETMPSRTRVISLQSWRNIHLHTHTNRFTNTLPPNFTNQTTCLKHLPTVSASVHLLLACYYSRLLRNALERSKRHVKTINVKDFLLIDEAGNNLGVMDRDTAFQLAESKGLELVQVRKETPEMKAVCKLVSKQKIWGEKKQQKQAGKKDPRNITKEITVSTSIAEHDLAVKVHQMKGFLEKQHNVKVSVEARVRRGELLPGEKQMQKELLESMVKELKGVGVQVAPENFKRFKLVCTFKSVL